MAGVGPEATRVFGPNAQTAVIPKRLGDRTHRPAADLPNQLDTNGERQEKRA
jgi:hypothetical protein